MGNHQEPHAGAVDRRARRVHRRRRAGGFAADRAPFHADGYRHVVARPPRHQDRPQHSGLEPPALRRQLEHRRHVLLLGPRRLRRGAAVSRSCSRSATGHVAFLEKQVGGFVQDEIRVRPNLSVALGLRYDWQNYAGDTNNLGRARRSPSRRPRAARRSFAAGRGSVLRPDGHAADPGRAALRRRPAAAVCDSESRLSEPDPIRSVAGRAAAEHRDIRAGSPDPLDASVQPQPRAAAPQTDGRERDLHRLARFRSVPVARHQRAAAAALSGAAGSGARVVREIESAGRR